MLVAQELYEGINLGDRSSHGLITYMRTDSLRISEEARENAKKYIVETYGESYYPKTPNIYKMKKNSQDAHEAIRPTDVTLHPDAIKSKLSADQYKIYKMIWQRFVASQMCAADFDTIQYKFDCKGNVFTSGGYVVKFPGYLTVYGAEKDVEETENDGLTAGKLPSLTENSTLLATSIATEQKFTDPPLRYTDGTLTKILAEMGVGRPSTFVPTITTIISRGYVEREGKFLKPTNIGEITVELMMKAFPHIIDYNYTAEMEESLEEICTGSVDYKTILSGFYEDFIKQLDGAATTLGTDRIEIPSVKTDIICEKCGAVMIEKSGRFGKFAACPNYPTCTNTKKLTKTPEKAKPKEETDKKCPKCGSDMVLRSGSYGSFYACSKYPECKTTLACIKETGVNCPKCGKRIIVKQGKNRRTFYSCEDYPNCDFSCWDIPQKESCPKCGAAVLKKKTKEVFYCSLNCGWKVSHE
jgi:DNA topoisomerase-1